MDMVAISPKTGVGDSPPAANPSFGSHDNSSASSGTHERRMTTRRKAAGVALKLLISLGVFAVGLEIAFRICPWAVPAKALVHFEPALRAKLAQGRFPTRADTILLPRDDGGDAIRIFKPFAVKPYGLRPFGTNNCGAVREVKTDEIGFGNPPGIYDAHAKIDLVAIGDSFTWPSAVEPGDAWPIRLGERLGCTSYNLGRGGNGPYEYLQILKRYGLAKSPRVVVMNLYEGNDILNVAEHLAYRKGATPGAGRAGDEGKTGFLWRRSLAWNLVAGSVIYWREHARFEKLEGRVDYRFHVGSIPFNPEQSSRDEVVYARRAVAGEIPYEVFDEPLREFKRLADDHGFRPVLAYTPAAAIAYSPAVFRDPGVGSVLEAFSRDQRRHLEQAAGELGISFIDLTPALQEIARAAPPLEENLLYFPGNIHLTPRGHAAVARILAGFLRDRMPGAEPGP